MKTFTKLQTTSIIKSKSGAAVEINKYQKDGTKRTFWTPEINGTRLTRTMFARLYDAEKYAFAYLRHIESN